MGALASGPLVALYAAMWLPSARRAFPAVDSRQNGVTSTLRPILNNLTWAQARTCAATCSLMRDALLQHVCFQAQEGCSGTW